MGLIRRFPLGQRAHAYGVVESRYEFLRRAGFDVSEYPIGDNARAGYVLPNEGEGFVTA
jgi:hypothetical protein